MYTLFYVHILVISMYLHFLLCSSLASCIMIVQYTAAIKLAIEECEFAYPNLTPRWWMAAADARLQTSMESGIK